VPCPDDGMGDAGGAIRAVRELGEVSGFGLAADLRSATAMKIEARIARFEGWFEQAAADFYQGAARGTVSSGSWIRRAALLSGLREDGSGRRRS
jgi:hypothetical protein